jgi:ATP-dependent DNA ligase
LVGTTSRPPKWIKPQFTRLVDEAPAGGGWLHEIKYDGYRMHARIDGHDIKLLTRTGLDWSHRSRCTIEALGWLKVKSAYVDGELCALNADGVPVFSRLQAAMDEGRTDQLVGPGVAAGGPRLGLVTFQMPRLGFSTALERNYLA